MGEFVIDLKPPEYMNLPETEIPKIQPPTPRVRASLIKPHPKPRKESRRLSVQALSGACRDACSRDQCCNGFRTFMLVGTLTFLGLLIYDQVFGGRYELIPLPVSVGVLCFCYLSYVIASTCCNDYLNQICKSEVMTNIHQHIKQVQDAQPQLRFDLSFYHWERRTRRVCRTDQHGHHHYHYETYEVKVETWSGSRYLAYRAWSDNSAPGQLRTAKRFKQSSVEFYKSYQLVGPYSGQAKEAQRMQFLAENRCRDAMYDEDEVLEIPGFRRQALACSGESKPCYMNGCCYTSAALFLCEYPFRVCMLRSAPRDSYTFTKVIEV